METLQSILAFLPHIDEHLIALITLYGQWIYILLFSLIFIESAFIFLAFLPGDSLLFAAGALAANPHTPLEINTLFILLVSASVMGNGINYFLGEYLGPKLFIPKKHMDNAHHYFERYGAKTIIIARFIPIIRTLAPFIAGVGYMKYRKFFAYNLLGSSIWLGLILYGSFWFGNIPVVKQNFIWVILAIMVLSITPIIWMRFKISDRKLQPSILE